VPALPLVLAPPASQPVADGPPIHAGDDSGHGKKDRGNDDDQGGDDGHDHGHGHDRD
jgi:hypothetical protein